MKIKRKVVIGFVGSQLDGARRSDRWEKWRPSLSLMQHEDLLVDRFELLYNAKFQDLAHHVARDMRTISPETTVVTHDIPMRDAWDFEDVYGALFDFSKRYRFDTEHEDYWIHITTGTHVVQICLFLLTEARYLPGRLLQTSPPRRSGVGDPGSYQLIDLDLSRYDQIAQRFSSEQAEGVAFLKSGIPTRNASFNSMIEEIEKVAVKSRAPMLLMGPTGAGKSFLARRVFELKRNRHQLDGKFVELNCATVQGDGAASTLFGHIKGAFTGAASNRPGLLRSAHKGLLFLDEIGELGLNEQAMLLKALEEKRFLPVGSDEEVASDFQLIAGTNRDLGAEVLAGRFREDLYARVNLWTYSLPRLSERPEDIEPNVDFQLALSAMESGEKVSFNKEARTRYMRFAMSGDAAWSGNFRDLAASVTRLATLSDAGRITDVQVDDEIARLKRLWRHDAQPAVMEGLDLFDSMQLEAVIAVCRQSKSLSDAGRKLFAVSRDAKAKPNDADRLKKYLAKFDLQWDAL
ncbi:RNA repair transcriptional activator RtcR [Duganella phyllosphaerae]|uniref:Transcriptional regulatory protein QseF n=1 Tax=Duganella phyllosphaerae TaxID=762836 RepID=A0A1E7X6X5_9BURK|nr:RNA repair transcriptional activator RtcR [Duganella phyllosphaerae]OFA08906.1 transcriptional regulatory protein QseF [Duganella phyllosphaerae]